VAGRVRLPLLLYTRWTDNVAPPTTVKLGSPKCALGRSCSSPAAATHPGDLWGVRRKRNDGPPNGVECIAITAIRGWAA